jgi:hypothetical protein
MNVSIMSELASAPWSIAMRSGLMRLMVGAGEASATAGRSTERRGHFTRT